METMHKILKSIYYHDTDAGGVVYYANYLKYFEEGRTEYLKDRGVDISKVAKEGVLFVVRHVDIDYKSPACYGDVLEIFTRITKIKKLTVDFFHQAKKDGRLLVSANTQLVCIDSNFRPKAIPENIVKALNCLKK
jgi:acyl-CoA thioester hydrolase